MVDLTWTTITKPSFHDPPICVPSGIGTRTIAVSDLNNDGRLDLIIRNVAGHQDVVILVNDTPIDVNSTVTFQSPIYVPTNAIRLTETIAELLQTSHGHCDDRYNAAKNILENEYVLVGIKRIIGWHCIDLLVHFLRLRLVECVPYTNKKSVTQFQIL